MRWYASRFVDTGNRVSVIALLTIDNLVVNWHSCLRCGFANVNGLRLGGRMGGYARKMFAFADFCGKFFTVFFGCVGNLWGRDACNLGYPGQRLLAIGT